MSIQRDTRTWLICFDMCRYGTPYRKRTGVLTSCAALRSLQQQCPGPPRHRHAPLRGLTWCAKTQKVVWKTKFAQAYPTALCAKVAELIDKAMHERRVTLTPRDAIGQTAGARELSHGRVALRHVRVLTRQHAYVGRECRTARARGLRGSCWASPIQGWQALISGTVRTAIPDILGQEPAAIDRAERVERQDPRVPLRRR